MQNLPHSIQQSFHEICEFNEKDTEFISNLKGKLCNVTGVGSIL